MTKRKKRTPLKKLSEKEPLRFVLKGLEAGEALVHIQNLRERAEELLEYAVLLRREAHLRSPADFEKTGMMEHFRDVLRQMEVKKIGNAERVRKSVLNQVENLEKIARYCVRTKRTARPSKRAFERGNLFCLLMHKIFRHVPIIGNYPLLLTVRKK